MNNLRHVYLKLIYAVIAIAALVMAAGAPGDWPIP